MKSKLPMIIALVAVLAGAYKFVLAKPAASQAEPKPKVEGTVYILQKEFLVNLADGRYAKLSVGFVMPHGDTSTEAAESGGHEGGTTAPEGYGTMPQEAIVRDIITDTLTDASQEDLVSSHGREELKSEILKAMKKHTDVHPEEVLFMDVTVQ
jgi:flagellar basal body-associated protein FliL